MYDYQSDVDGDLSFVAGEVIKVTEDLGEWYRGSIGDRTGIFPGNYVQVLDEDIKVGSRNSLLCCLLRVIFQEKSYLAHEREAMVTDTGHPGISLMVLFQFHFD